MFKGLTNEIKWTEQIVSECQETVFNAHILPMPGSEWVPHETDMEVFGITATNEPRAYIMTLDLKDICHLLPNIGSAVEVELNVDQIFHTAPNFCLEGEALDALAAVIEKDIDVCELQGYDAVEGAYETAFKIICDEGYDIDSIRSREVMKFLTVEQYRDLAKSYLYQYNANVSDEAIPGIPSADTQARRMYDADKFALELRAAPFELPADHRQRIKDWIRQHKVTSRTPTDPSAFVGRRIKLPPGMTADVALFYLEVPLQPYWPVDYQSPPVALSVPQRTWPSDLRSHIDNITKESPQAVCAHISYKASTETSLMERWAIEKMSRLPKESLGNDWWDFSTRFHKIPAPECIDLLKWYPALQSRLGTGMFESEYAKVVETMARSRAGKFIINAPAGPNRSNFAFSVVQAIMSDAPDPPANVLSRLNAEYRRHVPYEDWEVQHEKDLYNQLQMAMWNNMSAEEKTLSRKKVDEFVPVTGRVAWIAPHDDQVDEAVERLIAQNPGKTILRIYCHDAEVKSLIEPETEPEVTVVASGKTVSETQMIEAYNSCLLEEYRKHNPASNKHSWSEQCLSRGHFDRSGCWLEMNPAERSQYLSDAEEALNYLLDRADAICATPSAFHKIYKRVGYSGFEPSFIIVDNANQLTEPSSLLPIAIFPDVPTMFVGDLEQDGPEVMASEESLRTSTATKRRTRSLLQRVEDAGYLDHQFFPNR
ncbi:hypothetical protein MKX07_008889 [Trichoderma sp. CBMAI-0711]|nr:hypothetical protein MKX07_008889 [Trichoderma sp. CBMAI-0711]